MPGVHDALSARLVERAGFPVCFLGGFAVSTAHLALPDVGYLSAADMMQVGRPTCAAVSIPVIADADVGYGNAVQAKRTVREFARAGFACLMVEDQVSPKRCGHVGGKEVVPFDDAVAKIRACAHARDEMQNTGRGDILIMARTDANATHGLQEAVRRSNAFAAAGADIVVADALLSEEEMWEYCAAVPHHKMLVCTLDGKTPVLPRPELEAMGFKLLCYSIHMLNAMIRAQEQALAELADPLKDWRDPNNFGQGTPYPHFHEVLEVAGFSEYDVENEQYATANTQRGATMPEHPREGN